MANNQYSMFGNLPTLPQYRVPSPQSTMGQIPQGGYSFNSLAQAAEQERLAQQQRATDRQNSVVGGYDQQIQNSRAMGDQGYQRLAADYDLMTNDARDTRARNMERIDKFGNSMRSDLNVKSQQQMAAASQNAIKRGLGNTTVANSLQRGAAFDNTRQQLALEDQLLQNRIATDTSLSAAYQGSLNTRATGLNQQFNQNMSNENTLTSQRLGYIGGIQESMDGVGMVSNLYGQGLGMENDNRQKGLDRDLTVSQSALDRTFRAGESQLERDARLREADVDRSWKAGETAKERDSRIAEAEKDRGFQSGETAKERDSRIRESEKDRLFQSTESERQRAATEKLSGLDRESREKISGLDRVFQASESKLARETSISQAALDRAFQGDQSLLQREAQKQEADIDRRWKEQQTKLDQAWQGKESAAERESRKQEAELDRQWQQRQAEVERNTKIQEAQKDREQQTRESEKDRSLTAEQNEKNRIAENDPNYGKTRVANPNLGRSMYGGYQPAYFYV